MDVLKTTVSVQHSTDTHTDECVRRVQQQRCVKVVLVSRGQYMIHSFGFCGSERRPDGHASQQTNKQTNKQCLSIYCKSIIYFRRHNNIMVYLFSFNITYIIILATCFDSYESSSGLIFKNYCTYCFTVFCLTVFVLVELLQQGSLYALQNQGLALVL